MPSLDDITSSEWAGVITQLQPQERIRLYSLSMQAQTGIESEADETQRADGDMARIILPLYVGYLFHQHHQDMEFGLINSAIHDKFSTFLNKDMP